MVAGGEGHETLTMAIRRILHDVRRPHRPRNLGNLETERDELGADPQSPATENLKPAGDSPKFQGLRRTDLDRRFLPLPRTARRRREVPGSPKERRQGRKQDASLWRCRECPHGGVRPPPYEDEHGFHDQELTL